MEFRQQRKLTFEEAERRYAELKRQHDAGQIDDEHFDAERHKLVVVDDEGRWWAQSRQSGQWHYHDGNAWIEATPPVYRRVGSGESSEQASLEQAKQGPTVAQRPGRRRGRLLIGLGVLGAVIVVGLVAVVAYSLTGGASKNAPAEAVSQLVKVGSSPGGSPSSSSPPSPSPPPPPTPPSSSPSSSPSSEEKLRAAVRTYYEAVDREDWSYTWDNLDSQTQGKFASENEWIRRNRFFAEQCPVGQSAPKIEAVSSSEADVSVTLTFKGCDTKVRDTSFVYEDGAWKHRFLKEELDLFLPDESYEEFARANGR